MEDAAAEFSRTVDIEALADEELQRDIEATPAECEALARRFGLLALDSLGATIRVRRGPGRAVHLDADFAADVVQSCVVTLEPVASHIADSFSITFSPEAPSHPGAEIDLSATDEDLPEPLTEGHIDVGEAVAQQLALALDPYPRAPGVVFEPAKYPGLSPNRLESGPFSVLASLRKRGQT